MSDNINHRSAFKEAQSMFAGGVVVDSLAMPTSVPKFVTQIPLVDVFERLRRVKADDWQRDFCNRLQTATENRNIKGVRAIIHAQPQLGKSIILVQTLPAWILGHEPLHRNAVATHNVSRSQRHAKVVIRIMQSAEYIDLFPSKDCRIPTNASQEGFATAARMQLNDAQMSYNPMGLQSGFVGSGADTLLIDDPYKEAKEASSETIRENIELFWSDTSDTRITEFANVFGMFHRYHQADFAGYLLATGEFDYWRYAAEADGAFIDDETGLSYPDPMNRQIGEYISPRFSQFFYEKQKKKPRTWYSQFQGKPTGEEGNTFNVKKIEVLDLVADAEAIEKLRAECVHWSRAWDNAATDGDAGAYTAGIRMGITLDERALIDGIVRERLNTAERYETQLETAEEDGFLVPVLIPQDPGSAGKDTAYQTKQMLEENRYTCYTEVVSGSKELRAQPFSIAVNSGKVSVALSDAVRREFFKELKNFPLSTFKDQVDAVSDAYRYNYKLLKSGTIVKNYKRARNEVELSLFSEKYGEKCPAHWKYYIGARISDDASKPSGAVILVHASANSGLKDTVFILDEYKHLSGNSYKIFDWIDKQIEYYNPSEKPVIKLQATSESIILTARQKLGQRIQLFDKDKTDGISEMNWYLIPRIEPHPFNVGEQSCGIYYLKGSEDSLLAARSESVMWKFNEKGEPQEYGGIVMDCVRMILHGFRTFSTPLTETERIDKDLGTHYSTAAITKIADEDERDAALQRKRMEIERLQKEYNRPIVHPGVGRFSRR